jgi:hypothetical protein
MEEEIIKVPMTASLKDGPVVVKSVGKEIVIEKKVGKEILGIEQITGKSEENRKIMNQDDEERLEILASIEEGLEFELETMEAKEEHNYKEDADDPEVPVPVVFNMKKVYSYIKWAKENREEMLNEREKLLAYRYY